eukprot:5400647-Prymnesium_polylepis.1
MARCTRARSFSTCGAPRPIRPRKRAYEKANTPSAKKQRTGKSDKSDKSDKTDDGAAAKGRKAEKGTTWSRFELGNRTVLGPSIYK